jgi:hypothetical protein
MFYRALVLLAATPLFAQFSQLVATDDGKQVYFISPLILYSGTVTGTQNRLYRIGPDGVFLVAEAPPGVRSPFASFASSDGVSGPQVSGDGSLVGFTIDNFCPAPCSAVIPAEAELQGARTMDLGPGTLQLSRNGRWALLTTLDLGSGAAPGTYTYTLIDLTTGQRTNPPPSFPSASRTLASDGTVLVQGGLWNQGKVTAIPFPIGLAYNPLALSDNAAVVVSLAYVPGPAAPNTVQLVATATATGMPTVLYRVQGAIQPIFIGLSNDGRHALYRVTGLASASGRAYVADTSTGQNVSISLPDGELATDGAISGDGTIAFLVTTLGRIVKVTLATGAVEPLIPPTPYVSNLSDLAIGSLVHLQTSYPGTVAD